MHDADVVDQFTGHLRFGLLSQSDPIMYNVARYISFFVFDKV